MGDQDGLWGLTGQGKRLRLAAWGLSRGDAHLAARPGLSLRGGTVGGAIAWSHPHESGKKDEETREERLPRKALKREFHRATPPPQNQNHKLLAVRTLELPAGVWPVIAASASMIVSLPVHLLSTYCVPALRRQREALSPHSPVLSGDR